MNIAFPALLIFLFFLPGLIFTLALYNTDDEPLSYIPLTYRAMLSFISALLLNMLWVWIIDLCTHYQIDLTEVLVLVSGAQSSLYTGTIKTISNNEIQSIVLYLVSIYAVSYSLGKFFNYIVIRYKLDRFKMLRFDNPWYYLFKGYELDNIKPDGVIISAVMEFAGQGYLYRGYLDSFYFDGKGNIDRLVLTKTARRKIENDKTDSETPTIDDRFYSVDGNYFVLKYAEIKNLNVQFIKLQLETIK